MNRKELESALIIYIGRQDSLLMSNLILSFSRNKVLLYDIDSKEFPEIESNLGKLVSKGIPKQVMKRFFLIEKAKDSDIIGIVVGTLGVGMYDFIINKKYLTKKHTKHTLFFFFSTLFGNFKGIEKDNFKGRKEILYFCFGKIECCKIGKFR